MSDIEEPIRGRPTREARTAFWVFLSFLVVFVGVTRGHFLSTDEVFVFQATESLWHTGRPSVEMAGDSDRGRGGALYAYQNSGQSIAALPLYGAGRLVDRIIGQSIWRRFFAGPDIAEPARHTRWGGTVEIFFVNLLNAVLTALLCAVFFAFNLRLGVSARWSLVATAVLGLASYPGSMSSGFFQHNSEALFLLWSVYFLHSDAERPDWRARAAAGAAAALMIQFRYPAVIALPGLVLCHLLILWRRRLPGRNAREFLRSAGRESAPFVLAVAAGFVLHAADQYWKFQTIHLKGLYSRPPRFDNPLLVGLHGYLFSPGDSIFLFSPLLVLLPWTFPSFRRRFPIVAFAILFEAAVYLLLFSKFGTWAGLWCFGPRYVTAAMPLLLLPLGGWMESRGKKAWLAVAPLAAVGIWMQILNVAVNWWSVDREEGYLNFKPDSGFLFIPGIAPPVAHARALFAGNWCVDMWLVNVYRFYGLAGLLLATLPLAGLLAFCVIRLLRSLPAPGEEAVGTAGRFSLERRRLVAAGMVLVAGAAAARGIDRSPRAPEQSSAVPADEESIEAQMMQTGLNALYARRDYDAAITIFRSVLARNPFHYGANVQIAFALDAAGRHPEAIPYWKTVLRMASAIGDGGTGDTARKRLGADAPPGV